MTFCDVALLARERARGRAGQIDGAVGATVTAPPLSLAAVPT